MAGSGGLGGGGGGGSRGNTAVSALSEGEFTYDVHPFRFPSATGITPKLVTGRSTATPREREREPLGMFSKNTAISTFGGRFGDSKQWLTPRGQGGGECQRGAAGPHGPRRAHSHARAATRARRRAHIQDRARTAARRLTHDGGTHARTRLQAACRRIGATTGTKAGRRRSGDMTGGRTASRIASACSRCVETRAPPPPAVPSVYVCPRARRAVPDLCGASSVSCAVPCGDNSTRRAPVDCRRCRA